MNNQISVLIVDDEVLILDCLSIYFEDEGFTALTATNAEEALELISKNKPHACITDMGLEGVNGEDFIIKAHAISPGTLFLLHTGASFTLTESLKSIGMTQDDIIIKPIMDFSPLSNRIMTHVSGGIHGKAT